MLVHQLLNISEAGKLALKWAKEQSDHKDKDIKKATSPSRSPSQATRDQIYTIVADQTTDDNVPLVMSVSSAEG